MKLIGDGAEAKVYFDPDTGNVVKRRIKKGYRVSEIDSQLRKQRTRREARILEKLREFAPEVLDSDEENMEVFMRYLEGPQVKEVLDKSNKAQRDKIMMSLGENVGKMHALNVTHGDLTTSNMILIDDNVKLIDFGLAFVSENIEHKAVDIHLLKHALESKHYQHYEELFESFLRGYKKTNADYGAVMKRFEIVEKRGRYKRKMGS